ncbi:MAG TPA: HAMP domain-containing sensor histidine kinase [Mucilaginibacter sp.]|nr:HAMP domain-containing sensor histidine kinase [Mucilaginibacter sp.]
MKLAAKYNRVNLITAVTVMLITGIIYYQAISYILVWQKDKDLLVEENEIFDYVKRNDQLPQIFESNDQQITFSPAGDGSVERRFIDTSYFKKYGHQRGGKAGEYESGRGLISSVTAGGRYYKIVIIVSKVETEDLIRLIFSITIGVILLLLLVLYSINRWVFSRLWQPFYNILHELKLFNIADNQAVPDLKTTIDEFRELNGAVTEMSSRAKHDYRDLKLFTENASHELLTPIAVINSKLDTLIQTENFSDHQSKLLTDLYTAVSRLNRLNQSLLLLVKIENRLLHDKQHLNLREITEEMVSQFEEIFADKNIKVSCQLGDKEIHASRYLAEILLSNLISNAIRHNYDGGEINIRLDAAELIIRNTGVAEPLPADMVFTRFHKSSGSEGSGLGLAISKQICDNFGFGLSYVFDEGYHAFKVSFG